jgi:hypothetical protein
MHFGIAGSGLQGVLLTVFEKDNLSNLLAGEN